MRTYIVYIGHKLAGVPAEEEEIEVPDDATEDEIEALCMEALDIMIGIYLDTGWYEKDGEK